MYLLMRIEGGSGSRGRTHTHGETPRPRERIGETSIRGVLFFLYRLVFVLNRSTLLVPRPPFVDCP